MVGEFLKRVGGDDNADVKQQVIDDSDAVVVLKTPAAKAMVFLTAETLPELKKLAAAEEKTGGTLAIVNSQIMNGEGSNLISDLGIGPWKKKNEDFLATFEQAYWISEQRIQGETIRLLKSYPYPWSLYVLTDMNANDTEPKFIQTFDEKPSYKELEAILMKREGSVAAMSIIDRVKREATFNATSVSQKPNNQSMDRRGLLIARRRVVMLASITYHSPPVLRPSMRRLENLREQRVRGLGDEHLEVLHRGFVVEVERELRLQL